MEGREEGQSEKYAVADREQCSSCEVVVFMVDIEGLVVVGRILARVSFGISLSYFDLC